MPPHTQAVSHTETHTVSVAIAASGLTGTTGVFLLRIIIIGDQESERRREQKCDTSTGDLDRHAGALRLAIPQRPDDKEMMLHA